MLFLAGSKPISISLTISVLVNNQPEDSAQSSKMKGERMIQKLYELAKYMPQEWISEYENDYGLFMDEKDVKVLVLSFSLSDNTCEYQGMHLEDYSKEKNLSKYYLKNAQATQNLSSQAFYHKRHKSKLKRL